MPRFTALPRQSDPRCRRLWRLEFQEVATDSTQIAAFVFTYHTVRVYQVRHQARVKPVQHSTISPAVCTRMLSSIYSSSTASKAQHSTAQHSTISPVQSSKLSTCRSERENASKQTELARARISSSCFIQPYCRGAFFSHILLFWAFFNTGIQQQ